MPCLPLYLVELGVSDVGAVAIWPGVREDLQCQYT
jgi:hypothetical protein